MREPYENAELLPRGTHPALAEQALQEIARSLVRRAVIPSASLTALLSGRSVSVGSFESRRRRFGQHAAAVILRALDDELALDALEFKLNIEPLVIREHGQPLMLAWRMRFPGKEGSVMLGTGELVAKLMLNDKDDPSAGLHDEFRQTLSALASGLPPQLVAETWLDSPHGQSTLILQASMPAVVLEAQARQLEGEAFNAFISTELQRRTGLRRAVRSTFVANTSLQS